ncbi:metal ABC transporter solute-binding protein, Zn/Mn family, partial [Kaarinaea lacus]
LMLVVLLIFPIVSFAKPAFTVGVSILPQKYFVERIAGDKARVIVMVGPGHNPATYEPKPRQLSQMEGAALYFLIGVPFETRWVNTFREINPNLTVIPLPESIELRPMSRGIESLLDNGNHDHSHASMLDPHVWLNPRLVKHIAQSIKTALVTHDPDNKHYYDSRYQQFIVELDELDQYIRQQLAGIKNPRFIVYHPSWGYFADEYALQQIPIEIEGKQPGAKTLSKLIALAQKNQVKVIFVQQQFSDRDAKTVAAQVGAKILMVDPLAENYIENLKRISQLFAEALL